MSFLLKAGVALALVALLAPAILPGAPVLLPWSPSFARLKADLDAARPRARLAKQADGLFRSGTAAEP